MAEVVVQNVLHLKKRLVEVSDPNKVLKLLKQLQDLNITVDILVETGIGKTVNGFRKNKVVGDIAKELVYQWKKLIPQETSRNSSEQNERKSNNDSGHFRKKDRKENTNKSSRLSGYEETLHMTDVNKSAKVLNEEESPEKGNGVTCYQQPSKNNPDQLKASDYKSSRKEIKEYSNCASKNSSLTNQQSLNKVQKCEKSKSSHKNQNCSTRKDKTSTHGHQTKKPTKDQHEKKSSMESSDISCNIRQEKSHSQATHENSKKNKSKSVDKTENSNLSGKMQKWSEKDKESLGSGKSQDMSHMTKEGSKGCKVEFRNEEEFEKPAMTFESYLNYEEPKRKAKKCHKNKNLPTPGKHTDSKLTTTGSGSSHSKESKRKRNADKREQHEEDIWLETPNKKVKIDINTLLAIPLPKFLPNVTDMPSDSPPTSPIKKSIPNISDSTVEFTGRRLNCKMQVYSGCKTTNILKMMTLYEQCIRVLQNNIDSIHEVGGVPFEIIEPVLERCTSEQLCRIEECNPSFIEQTGHFWMKHCKKDFKSEEPNEYESWRELYLRLYDEREQKLKILTQSISSAHANKPKGRQVKLAYVNTSAKPPRDILRQQARRGTAGSTLQSSPFAKHKMKSVGSTESSGSAGGSGSSDRPKSNSSYVGSSSHSGPDAKRQVKKVAPMMAKSLRAFKNRLGPRFFLLLTVYWCGEASRQHIPILNEERPAANVLNLSRESMGAASILHPLQYMLVCTRRRA
ncbi:elongin A, like isoform X3 [Heptranchias perlo]|uniref:elongin A, like isoform X3 n=1 Tax=Heptranchias perlo TaxID=212740 RepID=UPI00355939CA